MEHNETLLRPHEGERLLNDPNYFKYIFKKTEKIACAVFYILRQENITDYDEGTINDIRKSAKRLLNASLQSLRAVPHDISVRALELKFRVIELESELRIAHASNFITHDTLNVFLAETDSVLRSLKQYIQQESSYSPEGGMTVPGSTKEYRGTASLRAPEVRKTDQKTVESQDSRRDRILALLRDKGEASIKDVSEVITDCSEKTIQRDLNSLIKDNLVRREGERRWSKYSLI